MTVWKPGVSGASCGREMNAEEPSSRRTSRGGALCSRASWPAAAAAPRARAWRPRSSGRASQPARRGEGARGGRLLSGGQRPRYGYSHRPSRVVVQPECPSSCSGSNFLGKSNFLGSQEVVTWSTLEYQRNALISRHFWADFMELSAVQFPRKSVPKSVFSQKRRFPQKELDWSQEAVIAYGHFGLGHGPRARRRATGPARRAP